MTPPPHLPYAGRAKWVPVGLDLALAGAGAALAGGVLAALGDESSLMRALALYTCYAVATTVVLALVRALTRELPTLRRTRFEGEDAWEIRAWAGDWWHSAALDAGLVVLAGWLCVLGARAGQDFWVPTSVVAATGAWFVGRVAVSLLGLRGRQALWLTEHEVVHDSPSGRARAPRSDVTDVTGRGARVLIRLDRPAEVRLCPRPWRARRQVPRETITFACSDTGHLAADVAGWLAAQLDHDMSFRSARPGHDVGRR